MKKIIVLMVLILCAMSLAIFADSIHSSSAKLQMEVEANVAICGFSNSENSYDPHYTEENPIKLEFPTVDLTSDKVTIPNVSFYLYCKAFSKSGLKMTLNIDGPLKDTQSNATISYKLKLDKTTNWSFNEAELMTKEISVEDASSNNIMQSLFATNSEYGQGIIKATVTEVGGSEGLSLDQLKQGTYESTLTLGITTTI